MAIAIDATSPAIVTGNPTATTATFTPPDGAVLIVAMSGNTFSSQDPSIPTVTDSLGSHLTYNLSDWRSRPDDPIGHPDGQVAIWTATVGVGASMTVSVTNNAASNRNVALKVWVLTGAAVGTHGADSSVSASAIADSYTATADGSQGFLVACDWDALGVQTAGTGCTLDGSATIPVTQISYGFIHRTIADGANGGLTAMNLTLPSNSTNLTWAFVEATPLVGDPAEKDPPPFIFWHPPGEGLAPNGVWTPWTGTADAAPTDTGIRIHESSPGLVINPDPGTVATCITASFTPPAGSTLLVLWAGNSSFGANPSAPSITDSLGGHLTYTLSDWQSRADAPTVDGQAAAWTAPVASSAPMTVTVTNNAASGFRHAAMQVLVLTHPVGITVGAHGKTGSTSANVINQTYTAQATLGQGFLALADFSATGTPKAGMDCYLANNATAGTIPPTQLSYAMVKRTIPDDVNTVANRINVQMAGTSTALSWVYIEILPSGGSGGTAETGTTRLAVIATGAATKVATQTGSCLLAGATVGAARKTATAAGADVLTIRAAGAATKTVSRTGTALVALAAAGTETTVVSRAQTGSCTGALIGTGAARKVAAAAATGRLAVTTVGAQRKTSPLAGATELATRAAGAAAKVVSRTGTVTLALTASGAETAGTARQQTGTCAAALTSTGGARKAVSRTGTTTVVVLATAAARKTAIPAGRSAAAVISTAVDQKRALPAGASLVGIASTGAVSPQGARPQAGTAALTVRSIGTTRKTAPANSRSALALCGTGLSLKRAAATARAILMVAPRPAPTGLPDANATSAATVTGRPMASAVTSGRTSTAAVSGRTSSTPTVSDG